MALVIVEPALEADHAFSVLGAEDEGTGVARDRGGGEVGDVGEGDDQSVFEGIGKVAQAAAQDHAHLGGHIRAAADIVDGVLNAGGKVHSQSP